MSIFSSSSLQYNGGGGSGGGGGGGGGGCGRRGGGPGGSGMLQKKIYIQTDKSKIEIHLFRIFRACFFFSFLALLARFLLVFGPKRVLAMTSLKYVISSKKYQYIANFFIIF